MNCILCQSEQIEDFAWVERKPLGKRSFKRCLECDLTFLEPQFRLNPFDEKARYDTHNNSIEDKGYCAFLNQLVEPLKTKVHQNSVGLDYGCGPGPTIGLLMKESNVDVQNYDPYYFPDKDVLNRSYDFVTLSEVAEHFYNPREEFLRVDSLMKPEGSYCGVMTQLIDTIEDFSKWWYVNDPTHVCFYSQKTCRWIAQWLNWQAEFLGQGVVIFTKKK